MSDTNPIIKITKNGRRHKLFLTNNDKPILLGAYIDLKKLKRFDYSLNGKVDESFVTEVTATREDSRGRQKREFSLDKGLYNEIGEFTKVPGRSLSITSEVIDEAYYQFEDYIMDKVESSEKHIVPAYGIFDKGILFTPDKFDIEGVSLDDNEELKSFYEIFDNKEINNVELNNVMKSFYNYLQKDEINLLTFAFGYATMYRHYLFNIGLEDFPFLALISNVTNKGKSARGRTLINGPFLNWTTKSFHAASVLNGSDERFYQLNKIQGPIVFEEIQSLSNDKTSFLKQLATSSQIQTRISLQGGVGTHVRTFVRGGIMITANEIKEIDSTLKDRFVIVDLSEHKSYKECQDDYDYLKDRVGILSKFIWSNLIKYKDNLKLESKSREEAYKEVFKNGMRLVNAMVKDFGYEPLMLDIGKFLENKEGVIKTDKTRKKRKLIEFIKKYTTFVSRDGYIKKSIFDIQTLQNDDKRNKKIISTILNEAYYNGIVAGEEGILIGKTFLDKMKDEDDTFFNIKNVHNLRQFFSKDEVMSYRSGDNKDPNSYMDYYCGGIPSKKQKTGIMLTNIWKDEDKIDGLGDW